MTLSNAKVLYKHFKDIGRDDAAAQLVRRYPELGEPEKPVEKPKVVKKSGKRS